MIDKWIYRTRTMEKAVSQLLYPIIVNRNANKFSCTSGYENIKGYWQRGLPQFYPTIASQMYRTMETLQTTWARRKETLSGFLHHIWKNSIDPGMFLEEQLHLEKLFFFPALRLASKCLSSAVKHWKDWANYSEAPGKYACVRHIYLLHFVIILT